MTIVTLLRQVKKFETFSKTPERNKVHFKDGTEVNVNGLTKIGSALKYILKNDMV